MFPTLRKELTSSDFLNLYRENRSHAFTSSYRFFQQYLVAAGIKRNAVLVYPMEVSKDRLTAATFEELAMPLFDQLYNFAHWLTQDRSEAEDLVQETYTKALRGFHPFSWGPIFAPGFTAFCAILSLPLVQG